VRGRIAVATAAGFSAGASASASANPKPRAVALDNGVEAVDLSWRTGTEIRGLDLSRPDSIAESTIRDLTRLVSERCFLLFRNQPLDHDQHLAFTRRFGPLAKTGMIDRYAPPGYPDIYRVTNMMIDGVRSEVWDAARQWHSDQSFMQEPAMGSLLRCEIAPRLGGNTMWANMYLAYERLSDGLKQSLALLRAGHSVSNSRLQKSDRVKKPYDAGAAVLAGTVHPVVRTHPITGRKCLYISEMFVEGFEGWTVEESAPLLNYLNTFATQPAFTYRHAWQPGDLIFWDNRCALHNAPEDYDVTQLDAPENHRLMYRTTLAGTKPY
jgi:taurine dioxygenase